MSEGPISTHQHRKRARLISRQDRIRADFRDPMVGHGGEVPPCRDTNRSSSLGVTCRPRGSDPAGPWRPEPQLGESDPGPRQPRPGHSRCLNHHVPTGFRSTIGYAQSPQRNPSNCLGQTVPAGRRHRSPAGTRVAGVGVWCRAVLAWRAGRAATCRTAATYPPGISAVWLPRRPGVPSVSNFVRSFRLTWV